MIETVESLRQHQLVILRRLRAGPLTEFELSTEVADHSAHTREQAAEKLPEWLDELRREGLLWCGILRNANAQEIQAAALTKRGHELVG